MPRQQPITARDFTGSNLRHVIKKRIVLSQRREGNRPFPRPLRNQSACANKKYYYSCFLSRRNAFRQSLVQGDKPVIYPILQWLFQNMEDLKKRAYLARYLVRMDIPADNLADQDISELNETVSVS